MQSLALTDGVEIVIEPLVAPWGSSGPECVAAGWDGIAFAVLDAAVETVADFEDFAVLATAVAAAGVAVFVAVAIVLAMAAAFAVAVVEARVAADERPEVVAPAVAFPLALSS